MSAPPLVLSHHRAVAAVILAAVGTSRRAGNPTESEETP